MHLYTHIIELLDKHREKKRAKKFNLNGFYCFVNKSLLDGKKGAHSKRENKKKDRHEAPER